LKGHYLLKVKNRSNRRRDLLKQKQDAARQMAKLADSMLKLDSEYHLISEFSRLDCGFYEIPKKRGYDPNSPVYVSPAEAFMATLKFIAEGQDRVLAEMEQRQIRNWNDNANPPRFRFVGMLAHFWEDFSGEMMGAGPGGPSARFVSACFAPLNRHWKEVANTLDGPCELDSETAGHLIGRTLKEKRASYLSMESGTPDSIKSPLVS
jgi:hypothetical protein